LGVKAKAVDLGRDWGKWIQAWEHKGRREEQRCKGTKTTPVLAEERKTQAGMWDKAGDS
jgi:hypothetical protein